MKFNPPSAASPEAPSVASAREAYGKGHLGAAEAICRTLLGRQPRNAEAKLLLSDIAQRLGDSTSAHQLLGELLGQNPDSVPALSRMAQLLRAARNPEAAIELCSRVIGLTPEDAEAYLALGVCLLDQWRLGEAIEALTKATELRPGFGPAYDRLGRALQLEGRDAESAAAYRRAIELMPAFPGGYVNLGHLLMRQGVTVEAESVFNDANRVASVSADRALTLARTYRQAGYPEREEEALRMAVELAPNAAGPQLLLGQALQEAGHFDEAAIVLKKAIALHPDDPSLYPALIYGARVSEADKPLLAVMKQLAERASNAKERAHLHYALGKAYDDLRDYAAAIHYYHEANRSALSDPQEPTRDRREHSASIDTMISIFTPEFYGANRGFGSDSDEPIFIVGMQRSGTSLAEQIVSSHPNVSAAGEVSYLCALGLQFVSENRHLQPDRMRELAEGYLRRIQAIQGTSRVTDKMPQNFMMAGLIHHAFPNARIIHCRRNPIDTSLSIYFAPIDVDFSRTFSDVAFAYHEYRRLMAHWREVLPANRFFELDYESLVSDPEPVERRLIEFLGLDWDAAVLRHEANCRRVNTASIWQVRQPIHTGSVERWRRYEPWIGELLREFPDCASISRGKGEG